MSYLVDDHVVTWWGNAGNPVPDCIVVDTVAGGAPPGGALGRAASAYPGVAYASRYAGGGYQVACRAGLEG